MFSASLRFYASNHHIKGAVLFARKAAGIEVDQTIDLPDEVRTEHRAYVVGAIFAAVAFLESTVHELYDDATEPSGGIVAPLGEPAVHAIATAWEEEYRGRSANTLTKMKRAVELAGREHPPLRLGHQPYQDAKLLIALRNALTHPEPAWASADLRHRDHTAPGYPKVEALRGRFRENPLTGGGNPFFPSKCLGAGCASWAIETSLAATDDFFSRLDLTPRYASFHKGLLASLKSS